MTRRTGLDETDQGILQILSLYHDLDLSELWFEIGEAGTVGPVTEQEILGRLESLKTKGLVRRIALGKELIRWSLNRSQMMIDGNLQGAKSSGSK